MSFCGVDRSKTLFRRIFALGRERKAKWRFNQSSLFLDFLAGNQAYQCTPWSNPTRNVFGWQKPCYLLSDEGYAASFAELIETTPGSVTGPVAIRNATTAWSTAATRVPRSMTPSLTPQGLAGVFVGSTGGRAYGPGARTSLPRFRGQRGGAHGIDQERGLITIR